LSFKPLNTEAQRHRERQEEKLEDGDHFEDSIAFKKFSVLRCNSATLRLGVEGF
jgi:hypothetical protein